MMILKRRGQSTVEYTVLIIIILAVFVTMGAYVKRGFQGRWKSAVDNLGDQYDPRIADSSVQHSLVSASNTQIIAIIDVSTGDTYTSRVDAASSVERKQGNVTVGSY